MSPSRPHRFRIVPEGQAHAGNRRLWQWLLPAWLVSLVLAAWLAYSLGGSDGGARQAERELADARQQIEQLTRGQATAQASDRISRAALTEVQTSLAERDEEIAGLRADVAFYERLVGSTSQRKGLNAHSVEFSQEAAGSWHYTVVLTQNLNRGAISQGQMRFSVEGVKDGKLTTVSWDELHQRQGVAGQAYSFRYFQQLAGSVMMPADFTPQRVRISLSGSGGNATQVFDWKLAGSARGE
jgi:hypothetical protein